jgi:hypothetical protein
MLVANEVPELNEEIWNAWVAKSKVREQRTARRMRASAGIALSIFAIVAALYTMR